MEEILKIQSLLHTVDLIRKRYQEWAESTGDNYNLFEITNIETNEKIHTFFIADLLNPKGMHGLGTAPLYLFFKVIEKKEWENSNYQAFAEKYYGAIDWGKTSGGFIDISLENRDGNSVVIENKINANDQNCQLERYFNSFHEQCNLLYLTLDGKQPSEKSRGNLKEENYFCISYKVHIRNWIEQCYNLSTDRPLLRETLKQYLTLVNTITGNSNNHKMSKEIGAVLAQNVDSIKNAFEISKSLGHMKQSIIEDFIEQFTWDNSNWKLMKPEPGEDGNFWSITFSNEETKLMIEASLEANVYAVGIYKPESEVSYYPLLFEQLQNYKVCKSKPNINNYSNYVWFSEDFGDVKFNDSSNETWVFTKNDLAKHVKYQVKELINYIEQNGLIELMK